MESMKIMVIDGSEDFVSILVPLLKKEPGIEVAGVAKDGIGALKMISSVGPELLIMDNLLGGISGLDFIRRINVIPLPQKPVIMLVTSFLNDFITKEASSLGVSFIFKKPVAPSNILERVRSYRDSGSFSIIEAPVEKPTVTLLRELTDMLLQCRMLPDLKGYAMVRYAIMCVIENPDLLGSVTKELYPKVAERFDSTMQQAERNIRHAVKTAWTRCDPEVKFELFGYISERAPTNSSFIATLADKAVLRVAKVGISIDHLSHGSARRRYL